LTFFFISLWIYLCFCLTIQCHTSAHPIRSPQLSLAHYGHRHDFKYLALSLCICLHMSIYLLCVALRIRLLFLFIWRNCYDLGKSVYVCICR
jgi:hypothetical protein